MVLQNNTYELYRAFSIQIVMHVGLFPKFQLLIYTVLNNIQIFGFYFAIS